MTRRFLWLALLCAAFAGTAHAEEIANPWAGLSTPATGAPAAIGSYSAGCLRGGTRLPADGKGYQLMRPSRQRDVGHPVLVEYIQDLGEAVLGKRLGVLLVGDLGQVRGGPAPSGHSSHQSGLDVDVWFWHPKKARSRKLSKRERERLESPAVVDLKKKKLNGRWSPRIARMLELAATDDRVARIFVNPVIKKHLCQNTKGDRSYLRKLRPWYGHHDHFHVRLECPTGSSECESRTPLGPGDGCDELDWWLDDKAQAERQKGRKKYQSNVGALPELPQACQDLLR